MVYNPKMTKRSKQLEFEGLAKPKATFGGSLLKNSHAKTKRPLESKLPIHLVLRANRGGMRSPKSFQAVNEMVYGTARKYGVKVYEYANVGNHLHLLIKLPHIRRWLAFIRELTGKIALKMGGRKFWKQRPFTRIVAGWKRAYRIAKQYVHLNTLEAEGFISRKETKTLKDLHAIWQGG